VGLGPIRLCRAGGAIAHPGEGGAPRSLSPGGRLPREFLRWELRAAGASARRHRCPTRCSHPDENPRFFRARAVAEARAVLPALAAAQVVILIAGIVLMVAAFLIGFHEINVFDIETWRSPGAADRHVRRQAVAPLPFCGQSSPAGLPPAGRVSHFGSTHRLPVGVGTNLFS